MSAKDIPDVVKKNVRAVLLSKIGGVPLAKFGKDYRELLGQPFAFKELGYPTLRHCLGAMQDVVRLETKADGIERLYGIADDSSFMSSFAIKAQFPEYEEKRHRDRRKKNKRGGGGGNTSHAAMGQQRGGGGNTSHSAMGQQRHKSTGGSSNKQNRNTPNSNFQAKSVSSSKLPAQKYPELVGNMKGLYGIVVQGAGPEVAQTIEALFAQVGPVAEKSEHNRFLFFRFSDRRHAVEVLDKFDGYQLGSYRLHLRPAKEKIPDMKRNNPSTIASSSPVSTPKEPIQKDNKEDVQLNGAAFSFSKTTPGSERKDSSIGFTRSNVKETTPQNNTSPGLLGSQPKLGLLGSQPGVMNQPWLLGSPPRLTNQPQNTAAKDDKEDEDLSPTEEKVQEINANLLKRMNGLDIHDDKTQIKHHDQRSGNKKTIRTDTNVAAAAAVTKSKYTDVRLDADMCNDGVFPQRPNKAKPQNSAQSRHHNSNSRKAKTRQVVEVGSNAADSRGHTSTRRQQNVGGDYVDLVIDNIANSCLEKDVHAFMDAFNPQKINFIYPAGNHVSFSAIAQLTHVDAERAIQTLNGNVLYGMPLSVRPKNMKKMMAASGRSRVQSEGSSLSSESIASAESGKALSSLDTKNADLNATTTGPDASGDWSNNKPMPSLADFLDRFSEDD